MSPAPYVRGVSVVARHLLLPLPLCCPAGGVVSSSPRCVPVFQLVSGGRCMATRRKAVRLSEGERESQLNPLLQAQWSMVESRDAIKKTFIFTDFNQAWGWMNRVALAGEKMDHHPEWFNVYNRVEVTWSTHDCSGLSAKDVKMATFCDDTYKPFKK